MLFRREILDGIADGRVNLAFRRWRKPSVKAGSRVRTASGVVPIVSIETVEIGTISNADAKTAGYASREALLEELGANEEGKIYRIALGEIEADARIALRAQSELSASERSELRARFDKWEKSAPGYFPAILKILDDKPATAAGELASSFGVEKLKFKQDVRKLKELGLTESLDVGYRLSPRGKAVLKMLGEVK
jgi:hypothetical protein